MSSSPPAQQRAVLVIAILASFVAFLEGAYALTKRPVFANLSRFWLRIFAISFGMGVVTGIVMPFQFGTNWSRFSDTAANIISPLLAYEGLTAFFLEATFLGVLLFGRALVPPFMHFVAAVLVALGRQVHLHFLDRESELVQRPEGDGGRAVRVVVEGDAHEVRSFRVRVMNKILDHRDDSCLSGLSAVVSEAKDPEGTCLFAVGQA